jgi:20S proteasome subunit beta 5
MNSLIQRYAGSGAAPHIQKRNASIVDDDDDCSDAMWGSVAGYGSLARGVPSFVVPSVQDVSRCFHVTFVVSLQ